MEIFLLILAVIGVFAFYLPSHFKQKQALKEARAEKKTSGSGSNAYHKFVEGRKLLFKHEPLFSFDEKKCLPRTLVV